MCRFGQNLESQRGSEILVVDKSVHICTLDLDMDNLSRFQRSKFCGCVNC